MRLIADCCRDLLLFRMGHTVRRLATFVALLAPLAIPGRRLLLVDAPAVNDGHALVALELSMTRVFCGAGSSFPTRYRVPHHVRDHPEERFVPLKQLAAGQAGSLAAYCAGVDQPFINNENSLTVVETALLSMNPDLSLVQLGRRLQALRVGIIVAFAATLVAAGLAVLPALAIVVGGVGVLRTVGDLLYSLYPFLMPLILLSICWYAWTWRWITDGGWVKRAAASFAAGMLAGFSVNMRSSHLTVYAAMFAFVVLVARGPAAKRSTLPGRARRVLALAAVFVAGFLSFQYVVITRHLPRDMVYSASYHTVAHPLVLSLAIPASELSQREGIQWSDEVGITLAQRMIPTAIYLGPNYDEALFKYYRHLWQEYPREMIVIYVRKLQLAGMQMIAVLRGGGTLEGRGFSLALAPYSYCPNGVCLLALFLLIVVGAAVVVRGGGSRFALMLGLMSVSAALLLLESAIIMPAYVPSYHAPLAMDLVVLSVLGGQALLMLGWTIVRPSERPEAAARKTELYFESISGDFRDRMNSFDVSARVAWFAAALGSRDARGKTIVDVGAGLGDFSDVATRQGARPVPIDIAPSLVRGLHARFPSATCASALSLPFATASVDFVVSSECIEHTPDPPQAIAEMLRILKPGGVLFLTTPNLVWRWSVPVAEWLHIRHFEGLENWLSRGRLRGVIEREGGHVESTAGLHILPFQLKPLLPVIDAVNRRGQWLKGLMINQCWVVRKNAE